MANQPDNFSSLIKKVRKQLNLSQVDLAEKLGVSFATINRWENEKTMPSKLAKMQVESFCRKMQERGKLKIEGVK